MKPTSHTLSLLLCLALAGAGCSAAPEAQAPGEVADLVEVGLDGMRRPGELHLSDDPSPVTTQGGTGTSTQALITFWGNACATTTYGWGRVAGPDLDFYVEYACPRNATEYRAYASVALSSALYVAGKPLLWYELPISLNTQRRFRIVLGGSAVRNAFGNALNSFLATQAEIRWR